MNLIDAIREIPGRPVVPLAGYPGVAATGHTARQALTDLRAHLESLLFLEERYHPLCQFHVMDLTVEAEAVGLPVRFADEGPPSVAEHPVTAAAKLDALSVPAPEKDGRMPLFLDVVRNISPRLRGMAGAYCVGPFTLAGELCGAEELALRTLTDPGFARELIGFSTLVSIGYAGALAREGARVVAVLEPTAVILSPKMFEEMCLGPLCEVADGIRAAGAFPVLHICGDSTHLLGGMVASGPDGLSLDSPVELARAIDSVPPDVVVLGNVDPVGVMVEGTTDEVREAASSLVSEIGDRENFVLGTGCDLPGETPLENLDALFSFGV